jgi:Flp pilus assembly protein TadD
MIPERTTMARAAPVLGLVAVLALTAAVYAPSLQGAFVLDDQESVERNAALRAPDAMLLPSLPGMLGPDRPLTQVTYALDLRTAGLDPVRFHLVGVLLHLGATALAFAFLRGLLGRARHPHAAGVALAAAAIFALHPIQAESVAYVSQRAEVLASLLYLASLLLLDAAAARWMAWRGLVAWAGGLVAWVLAMGAKVIAVTQPATFLLDQAMVAPEGEVGARPAARRALRALALAAPILALAAWSASLQFTSFAAQPSGGAGFTATKLSAAQYLLTQLRVQWLYLRLLAWPRGFSFDRGFEPSLGPDGPALLAGAGLAALVALALWLWWRAERGQGDPASERPAAFGILFWFVVLSPTSSFVPLLDLAVEHRVYLASLGPFLAGTVAVDALLRRGLGARAPRAAAALLMLLVAVLGVSTYGRARTWGSTVDLLRESSAANPDSVRIRVNLAVALKGTGNLAAAEVELRQAARLAHTVTGVVDVATNLGALLIDTGRAAEAIPVLDQGLRASPQETILLVNRSAALRILGRYPEAVEAGRRAVAVRPDDPYARTILGMALLAAGDLEGGLAEVRAAGALDPGNPEFPVTEAIALARAGRRVEACATLRRARATTHVLPMPRDGVRAAALLGCPIE